MSLHFHVCHVMTSWCGIAINPFYCRQKWDNLLKPAWRKVIDRNNRFMRIRSHFFLISNYQFRSSLMGYWLILVLFRPGVINQDDQQKRGRNFFVLCRDSNSRGRGLKSISWGRSENRENYMWGACGHAYRLHWQLHNQADAIVLSGFRRDNFPETVFFATSKVGDWGSWSGFRLSGVISGLADGSAGNGKASPLPRFSRSLRVFAGPRRVPGTLLGDKALG